MNRDIWVEDRDLVGKYGNPFGIKTKAWSQIMSLVKMSSSIGPVG